MVVVINGIASVNMSYDLSDEEFCETNFGEPSPIKMRNHLLPEPTKWKEMKEKRDELRSKMKETEAEFRSFLESKLKKRDNVPESPVTPRSNELSTVEEKIPDNQIKRVPDGRKFFEDCHSTKNSIEPSAWFNSDSIYHSLTLDDFLKSVRRGLLLTKTKTDSEEAKQLRLFCLEILKHIEDSFVAHLLLQFLSAQPLPFDMVNLKNWESAYFSRLLEILEKSLKNYSPTECRQLFREGCLVSLDKKTFSYTYIFSSFLTTCLEVSSKGGFSNLVAEEIEWLIDLKLEPEECFHLLKILPQSGTYNDFGVQFAIRALQTLMMLPTHKLNCKDLDDVVELLKENEPVIRSFSRNSLFNFLNVLLYIVARHPINIENQGALGEILWFVESLKHHHQRKNNKININKKDVTYLIVYESINRMCLTLQLRIPLQHRRNMDIIQSKHNVD